MAIASAHKAQPTVTNTAHKAPLATQITESTLTWTHIPLVPQVAIVGHQAGMPVAIIDQIGSGGFRASLCDGTSVGIFRTLDESKQAVVAALKNTQSPSPAT